MAYAYCRECGSELDNLAEASTPCWNCHKDTYHSEEELLEMRIETLEEANLDLTKRLTMLENNFQRLLFHGA